MSRVIPKSTSQSGRDKDQHLLALRQHQQHSEQNKHKSATSDLDGEVLRHHAVPGGEVSVDELFGVEVGHAVGNFCCHLQHVFQSRWWAA